MNDRQEEEIEVDDGMNIDDDLDEDLDELEDEDRGVVGNDNVGVEDAEERGDRVTREEDVEDEETMKGR